MNRRHRETSERQHARHIAALWFELATAQVLIWLAAQDDTRRVGARR